MSLLRQGKAEVLTIYLDESDQWHGTPLYVAIIQLLRNQGCAGATVMRAIAGYGAGTRLHESGHLRWSSDAPLVIQVIDQPARLHHLLPQLQEMLVGGLMTLQEVEVLKYTHARRRGFPAKLSVQQVMETQLTTVSPDTPVATVMDSLLAAPFRALPVVDSQHRLLGIICTGDLIQAGLLTVRRGLVRRALELDTLTGESIGDALAQARQSPLTAQTIMNRQVLTVSPALSVREAAQEMIDAGVRRLPVVEADGTLVGMLTRADLLQVIVTNPLMSSHAASGTQPLHPTGSLSHEAVQRRPVTDYLVTDVATVHESAPLDEVIDALILSPLKRVVVVDNEEHVQGIISDVDILAHMQAEQRPGLLKLFAGRSRHRRPLTDSLRMLFGKTQHVQIAADIMNREVVTIADTASVQETIEKMIAAHRKILPVVDQANRLIGVVGRSDLLRVLAEA